MAETDPYKPVTCDLTRVQGDTTPFRWLLSTKVAGVKTPLPNSGFTYKMEADPSKTPANESNQQFALTYTGTGDGVISFPPAAGDPVGTGVNVVGKFFYQVKQTDGAGKTRTIIDGSIKFVAKIPDAGTTN